MSDPFEPGVLYTDHTTLAAGTPFPSLWSYESCVRCGSSDPPDVRSRRSAFARLRRDRPHEHWLHRSDPLLNTMLPGTQVSIVVNLGDRWVAGRSLPATSLIPPIAVYGPFTQPRPLRVGRHVRALGIVLPALLARDLLGVPAPHLVNQIVALDELWRRNEVERLHGSLIDRPVAAGLEILREELLQRLHRAAPVPTLEGEAARLLSARRGRLAIDTVAAHYGISRQRFARRFQDATGVSPKLFARIVRFQGLVYSLLSTDVSEWAEVAPGAGFYDQAHMINEFRGFTGAPPTTFFQPHDATIDPARIQVRGRPSEWLR
jgi:AraC-like DNA-binding protein